MHPLKTLLITTATATPIAILTTALKGTTFALQSFTQHDCGLALNAIDALHDLSATIHTLTGLTYRERPLWPHQALRLKNVVAPRVAAELDVLTGYLVTKMEEFEFCRVKGGVARELTNLRRWCPGFMAVVVNKMPMVAKGAVGRERVKLIRRIDNLMDFYGREGQLAPSMDGIPP